MTWSLPSSLMPRTPAEFAALEHAHVGDGEADGLPLRRGQQHVLVLVADRDTDDAVALVELHGDLAVLPHLDEVGELVAPDGAAVGGEHDVELGPASLILGQRQDGGDVLVLCERQEIDERLAAGLRRRDGQAPYLHLVGHAARGEEQHRRMRIGDEDAGDEILFARRHAGAAFAAAALRPIGGERHALDVALVAHGDDHVLALDQVFVLDLGIHFEDLGAPRRAELRLDAVELVLDDGDDARARAEDGEIVGDLAAELRQLIADLVTAERGQALEPEVEDGAGLILGEAVGAFRRDLVARVGDKLDQGDHVLCRPVLGHQLLARRGWVRRFPDQRNDLIDIGDGDGEADQHMGAIARLAQQELDAPADHLLAEIGEGADHILEVELLGPAADQRHDVGAEGRLQRREAVELVQHHISHGVALQLDDHAHAVAARTRRECRRCLRSSSRARARRSSPPSSPCSPDRESR